RHVHPVQGLEPGVLAALLPAVLPVRFDGLLRDPPVATVAGGGPVLAPGVIPIAAGEVDPQGAIVTKYSAHRPEAGHQVVDVQLRRRLLAQLPDPPVRPG